MKFLLRLVFPFHNVDSVTYVTVDDIMLTLCILFSRSCYVIVLQGPFGLWEIYFGRSLTYSNLEPIYVKILLVNIKILPFHWMSNLHLHIFKFWRHPRASLFIFSDLEGQGQVWYVELTIFKLWKVHTLYFSLFWIFSSPFQAKYWFGVWYI